nr:MAG TPA: hypothetical protein [Caudoviricetes sp.]
MRRRDVGHRVGRLKMSRQGRLKMSPKPYLRE